MMVAQLRPEYGSRGSRTGTGAKSPAFWIILGCAASISLVLSRQMLRGCGRGDSGGAVAGKFSFTSHEIVDPSCSFLPPSVNELEFPLHKQMDSAEKPPPAGYEDLQQLPLVWLFDSGVTLKTEYLLEQQMARFSRFNLWERADEPILIDAVQRLYHRCERERCVFVDGGAAYGYYSQLVRMRFPLVKVLAFNPHPRFVEQMIDNLSVARVLGGVCLQAKGLSNEPGLATMPYGVGGKLGNEGREVTEVEITTLDDYWEDFGRDKLVVAIKLDIEGHAGKAIRGGKKMISAAHTVVVGTHNDEELNECKALKIRGFRIMDEEENPKGARTYGLCVATKDDAAAAVLPPPSEQ